MFKTLKIIFLSGIIAACILVSRVPFENTVAELRTKYFPCQSPITYSIDTFDPRFGISMEDFKKDIVQAEAIWEKPIGKDLFKYTSDGGLKINLMYDYRQDTTETLKKLGLSIDTTQASYTEVKKRYTTLQADYLQKKAAFTATVTKFQKDRKTLDTEIAYWNARGGAKGEDYTRIIAEGNALNARAAQIQKSQDSLNAQVDTVNALVVTLNQLAASLNMTVSKFNEIGKETGDEFDEALYIQDATGQRIEVYQFSNNAKLVRVLAHELGHALGLQHVDDPRAIMYRLNKDTNEELTADDLAALKNKCEIK